MVGLQADAAAVERLAARHLPDALAQLGALGVPLGLVCAQWLLPLLGTTLPSRTLYRLWDAVLFEVSLPALSSAALSGAASVALRLPPPPEGPTVLVGAACALMARQHSRATVSVEGAMRRLQHCEARFFDSEARPAPPGLGGD